VQNETEAIVVLNSRGDELVRYGNVDEKVLEYLESEPAVNQNYRSRVAYSSFGGYELYSNQKTANSEIIYKIVPGSRMGDLWYSTAVTPLILLVGFLIGLFQLFRTEYWT